MNDMPDVTEAKAVTVDQNTVLVLSYHGQLRPEAITRLKRDMKMVFPDQRIVILEDGMTLSAYQKEANDE